MPRSPRQLVGNFLDLMRLGHALTVHCDFCQHRASVSVPALAKRLGVRYRVQTFIERAVCSKCGACSGAFLNARRGSLVCLPLLMAFAIAVVIATGGIVLPVSVSVAIPLPAGIVSAVLPLVFLTVLPTIITLPVPAYAVAAVLPTTVIPAILPIAIATVIPATGPAVVGEP